MAQSINLAERRVLVLRHIPDEPLGHLAHAFQQEGLLPSVINLYCTPLLPVPLSSFCGVVLMGGPQSVHSGLPVLQQEEQLVADAIRLGLPVLGICLGAQIVAKLLGARVQRCPQPEVGFLPVHATPEAASDPLMHTWEAQTVFHWHNECFDLPGGAVRLAYSDHCETQAFRYGERTWGIQFHLEITPPTIAQWIAEDAASDDRECLHVLDPHYRESDLRLLAGSVLGAWARLAAARE